MNSLHEQDYLNFSSNDIDEMISQGSTASVDPEVADHMGAFEETALDDDDAQMSLLGIDWISGELAENWNVDETLDAEVSQ